MTSTLADMKVSSLACKCVYYRPEHNAKGRPHSIECVVLECGVCGVFVYLSCLTFRVMFFF